MGGVMKLRVDYVYDDEAKSWSFHVPGLHVVGGGDPTREDAERHCLAAIGFTLEAMGAEGEEPPPGEVTEYEVQLVPASR
jgi:hypothetical protein